MVIVNYLDLQFTTSLGIQFLLLLGLHCAPILLAASIICNKFCSPSHVACETTRFVHLAIILMVDTHFARFGSCSVTLSPPPLRAWKQGYSYHTDALL